MLVWFGFGVVYTGWYWLLRLVTISVHLIVLLLLCLDMGGFDLLVAVCGCLCGLGYCWLLGGFCCYGWC